MLVLVVLVMQCSCAWLERLVNMLMLVALGDVQPDAERPSGAAASQKVALACSPRSDRASAAPKNGATEK